METLQEFRRDFFDPNRRFTRIGGSFIGGKAQALVSINQVLSSHFPSGSYAQFEVNIPSFTVLGTEIFDNFLQRNSLYALAYSDAEDQVIAHEFQKAEFPVEFLGDLRGLIEKVRVPLAIRSSSLLEDSLQQPFAGIYTTKMIPNNQAGADDRFRRFLEAIKLVYASAFFRAAKDYIRAIGLSPEEEKMAVVIQEVVGMRYDDRFYPDVSGVARSFNYYASGRARPEQGIVSLALGLGKTIVDGGKCWTYSPALPKIGPPAGSTSELLDQTQTKFWAVNMGKPPAYDPIQETEYLVWSELSDAEFDGTLRLVASTYDAQADRLTMGLGREGPRVLNFAGILQTKEYPLNDLIQSLLNLCTQAQKHPVEIEFAATLHPPRFGFLQVRPMMVSAEEVRITNEEWNSNKVFLVSNNVLGNGIFESIQDILYVDPARFDFKFSGRIALEIEELNRKLLIENRPYVLIGFGRWGSADPWLGIPVNWGQVSGAKVIVEATLPSMAVDLSQGSHFFHNLISFKVAYFSVREEIRWTWLKEQPCVEKKEFVCHVALDRPLRILVDGKTSRGIILTDRV